MRWHWIPVVLLCLAGCGGSNIPHELIGPYRLADGTLLSIRPGGDETLRWRDYESGQSGRLFRVDALNWEGGAGFSDHEPVAVRIAFELGADGRAQALRRTTNDGSVVEGKRYGRERWLSFENEGATLQGRLMLPEGDGPFPAVVFAHGSGTSPGSDWLYTADFFTGNGIASLAFDKRGTGKSNGEYTMDFRQLARDVVAGVEFLREQPEIDDALIGVSGYSQGGWVGPLSSTLTDLRFVIVNYGMIESPTYEARTEMQQKLEDAGVAGGELEEAMQVVDASIAVVASDFQRGWDVFGPLKKQHKSAAWRSALKGTPVDDLMRYPKWAIKLIGPSKTPDGLDWSYDSTQLMQRNCAPMTWLLGGADTSAPNDLTIPKLEALHAAGKPIDLVVFEGAEHGILLFDEVDGRRVRNGYAEGYWRIEVESAWKWIHERPECPPTSEE